MLKTKNMDNLRETIFTALEKSFSYEDYQNKMLSLVESKQSSGENQTEELVKYTKLNQSRMKRLKKTLKVDDATVETLNQLSKNYTWLVLTESWCGDAAQTMPVIDKIADATENINLRVAYRDENPELMQHFLTNGGAAIPKLIILNSENEVIADWGPRPTTATKKVNDFKEKHGSLSAEFKEQLQIWYNKDKGADTFNDLNVLLLNIICKNEKVIFQK